MKGVAPPEVTLTDVYAAAFPFVVMKLLILALLIAWPAFGRGYRARCFSISTVERVVREALNLAGAKASGRLKSS